MDTLTDKQLYLIIVYRNLGRLQSAHEHSRTEELIRLNKQYFSTISALHSSLEIFANLMFDVCGIQISKKTLERHWRRTEDERFECLKRYNIHNRPHQIQNCVETGQIIHQTSDIRSLSQTILTNGDNLCEWYGYIWCQWKYPSHKIFYGDIIVRLNKFQLYLDHTRTILEHENVQTNLKIFFLSYLAFARERWKQKEPPFRRALGLLVLCNNNQPRNIKQTLLFDIDTSVLMTPNCNIVSCVLTNRFVFFAFSQLRARIYFFVCILCLVPLKLFRNSTMILIQKPLQYSRMVYQWKTNSFWMILTQNHRLYPRHYPHMIDQGKANSFQVILTAYLHRIYQWKTSSFWMILTQNHRFYPRHYPHIIDQGKATSFLVILTMNPRHYPHHSHKYMLHTNHHHLKRQNWAKFKLCNIQVG